ncbi:MAG: hypothetical protein CM1200mP12_16080 [Gammaproteobacteria bacterium]|nr:MAG: hypothetical protein CM1200mP12_16080 [Gammaproteobacteria bacterium]
MKEFPQRIHLPLLTIHIHALFITATTPRAGPNAKEPTSPIKTWAG